MKKSVVYPDWVEKYRGKGRTIRKVRNGYGLYACTSTYSLTTSEIAYAVNSSKNFLNIRYLTSYHGAWYQNSSRDAGWIGDRIYVPSSIYGTGTFSAN